MIYGSGRCIVTSVVFLLLYGCGSMEHAQRDGPPYEPLAVDDIQDAVPKREPRSRYGNPPSYVVLGKRYYVLDSSAGYSEQGIASWYGRKFHGRRTSSGETYNMYAMTAAHKSLPLPTYVRVRNLENGRSAVVKVNDRGPFHDNRIIDLSYAAASKLGMMAKGTALVEVTAIDPDSDGRTVVAHQQTGPAGKPAPVNGFFIQCGAFSRLDNAERLRTRLRSQDIGAAHISSARVGNRILYRVRIGPLTDVAAADRIVSRLAAAGVHDHHIVVE